MVWKLTRARFQVAVLSASEAQWLNSLTVIGTVWSFQKWWDRANKMGKPEVVAPSVGVSADSTNGRLDLPWDDIITGTSSVEHKIAALYWDNMMNYNTHVSHTWQREEETWRATTDAHWYRCTRLTAELQKPPRMWTQLNNMCAKLLIISARSDVSLQ